MQEHVRCNLGLDQELEIVLFRGCCAGSRLHQELKNVLVWGSCARSRLAQEHQILHLTDKLSLATPNSALSILATNYASKMQDRGTLGKLKAMILSEYALEVPHWRVFGNSGP